MLFLAVDSVVYVLSQFLCFYLSDTAIMYFMGAEYSYIYCVFFLCLSFFLALFFSSLGFFVVFRFWCSLFVSLLYYRLFV